MWSILELFLSSIRSRVEIWFILLESGSATHLSHSVYSLRSISLNNINWGKHHFVMINWSSFPSYMEAFSTWCTEVKSWIHPDNHGLLKIDAHTLGTRTKTILNLKRSPLVKKMCFGTGLQQKVLPWYFRVWICHTASIIWQVQHGLDWLVSGK